MLLFLFEIHCESLSCLMQQKIHFNLKVDISMSQDGVDPISSSGGSGTRVYLQVLVAPDTTQTQVSVLIITPTGKFDSYGTSSITRSLIKNLRSVDPKGQFIKITCAVLQDETMTKKPKELQDLDVQLRGYIQPKGKLKAEAEVQWLNEDILNYYNHIVSELKYDFIIGHAPYFSYGCINLRDSCTEAGHTPKVILFVHELPRNEIEKQTKNNSGNGYVKQM